MKNRIFAFLTVGLLVLNLAGSALADTKKKSARKRVQNPLVAMLPASDGVVTLDAKRFFGDALPSILSGNQPLLGQILGKLDEVQAKTGIDLRQFESVAVGVAMKQVGPKEIDFEPVAIARGNISAGALVAIAKLASNGTYREEKIGGNTVYVFTAKDLAKKNAPKPGNPKVAGAMEKAIDGLTKEIAVTSLDANTLALGTLPRVRQTLEKQTRVDPEILNLLTRKSGAVLTFAAKAPKGLASMMPLDNDELGKNLRAIRYMNGSLDVIGGNTVLQAMAKTAQPEQAQGLLETLEGLQLVGKAFLGSSKGADKQVYARMIENAKFTRTGSEVNFELQVPQSDIDIIIGEKK